MTDSQAVRIVIAGIAFEPVPSSGAGLEHSLYLLEQIQRAGLRDQAVYDQIADLGRRAETVAQDIYRNDHFFTLPAGLLRRTGERWRRDQVEENARIFERASGRATVMQLFAAVFAAAQVIFALRRRGETITLGGETFTLDASQEPTSAPDHPPIDEPPKQDH